MSRVDVRKQIKYGAIISYGSLFLNIIISLLYTPWMVSKIGQSNYALYTLASSFISLFLVDFGLSTAASKYVAQYRAENREEDIPRLLSTIEWLYLIIDGAIIIVLTVLFFNIQAIYKGLTTNEINTYRELYIIVGIYGIISFPFMPLNGVLTAYEKFIQLKLCSMAQKILSVVFVVLALTFGASVSAVVLANAVAGVISILLQLLAVGRTGLKFRFFKIDKNVLLEISAFSLWTTVISIASRFTFNLAPTILGAVSNSTEIALFAPANTLEGYFYLFSSAVNGLFLTTVSRYIAENKIGMISKLFIQLGRYQIFVLGLIYVEFLCIGREFMIRWMGEDYVGAYPCALLMFLPDILLFSQQIGNTYVMALNKVKLQAICMMIEAAICVSLSIPLSKQFGAFGSSIAIAVSYLFAFIYMNVVYKRVLKLDIKSFFLRCYLRLSIPLVVSGIICVIAVERVKMPGIVGMLIRAIVVMVIYLSAFIPFTTRMEREKILEVFSRRR